MAMVRRYLMVHLVRDQRRGQRGWKITGDAEVSRWTHRIWTPRARRAPPEKDSEKVVVLQAKDLEQQEKVVRRKTHRRTVTRPMMKMDS